MFQGARWWGNKGFSMAELMVTLAVVSVGSLAFVQLQKNQLQVQKNTELRSDVENLSNTIGTILLSESACRLTFASSNMQMNQGESRPLRSINVPNDAGGSTGRVLFSSTLNEGQRYFNGMTEIIRYEYRLAAPLVGSGTSNRHGIFNLSIFYRAKSAEASSTKEFSQKVRQSFKVETDNAGNVVNCYSSIEDISDRVMTLACTSIGGSISGDRCNLTSPIIATESVSDISTNQNYQLMNFGNFRDQIYPNLIRTNLLFMQASTDEEVISGTIAMENDAHILLPQNANPNASNAMTMGFVDERLGGCNPGEVVIFTASGPRCENLLCVNSRGASQEYLVGINIDGTKVCNQLVANGSENCPSGGRLGVSASGSIEFQCCQPVCSASEAQNVCSGEFFPSGSGGCGFCEGTRQSSESRWSNWEMVAGSERDVGGCISNIQRYEFTERRTCLESGSCGGDTCTVGSTTTRTQTSQRTCTSECVPNWPRDNSANICVGHCVTQNDGCGNTRTLMGTSTATSPRCMQNAMGPGYGCGGSIRPTPTPGGCFIAGSWVTMSDRRIVKIEDIGVGAELLDVNNKVNTVKNLIRIPYKGPIYSINGSAHFFTPNHPLKTLDGWKSLDPDQTKIEIPDLKVEKLKLGDILIKENGLETIMSLDSKLTEQTVYNFELDGTHEFIVNDIGVHNKLMCPQAPVVGFGQKLVTCHCPEDECATYHVVPSEVNYACPNCR